MQPINYKNLHISLVEKNYICLKTGMSEGLVVIPTYNEAENISRLLRAPYQ